MSAYEDEYDHLANTPAPERPVRTAPRRTENVRRPRIAHNTIWDDPTKLAVLTDRAATAGDRLVAAFLEAARLAAESRSERDRRSLGAEDGTLFDNIAPATLPAAEVPLTLKFPRQLPAVRHAMAAAIAMLIGGALFYTLTTSGIVTGPTQANAGIAKVMPQEATFDSPATATTSAEEPAAATGQSTPAASTCDESCAGEQTASPGPATPAEPVDDFQSPRIRPILPTLLDEQRDANIIAGSDPVRYHIERWERRWKYDVGDRLLSEVRARTAPGAIHPAGEAGLSAHQAFSNLGGHAEGPDPHTQCRDTKPCEQRQAGRCERSRSEPSA